MAADGSGENCGYCLQTLKEMEDPRKLPCSHICCFECLETDYRKLNATECPVCKTSHVKGATGFPSITPLDQKMNIDQAISEPSDVKPPPECDVCDGDSRNKLCATTFCYNCGQNFCYEHLNVHDDYNKMFSKVKHKTILLTSGSLRPRSHKCDTHKEKLVKIVCTECSELYCDDCNLQIANCTGKKSSFERWYPKAHKLQSLTSVCSSIQEQADELSSKISDLAKHEKKLVKELESHEVWIDAEISQVEQLRGEMIERVNKLADAEILKFEKYREQCNTITDVALVENAMKTEERNEVWRSVCQNLSQKSPAEIAKERITLTAKMTSCISFIKSDVTTKCNFPQLPENLLHHRIAKSSKSDTKPTIPGKITPPTLGIASRKDHPGAVTVSNFKQRFYWASLKCVTDNTNRTFYLAQDGAKIHSITVVDSSIFILELLNNVARISRAMLSGSNGEEWSSIEKLFEFERHDKSHTHISIRHDRIATLDPAIKELRCYDFHGVCTKQIDLDIMKKPYGVHLFLGHSVLVSDHHGHYLQKISLTDKKAVWTCRELNMPTGICSDIYNLIYVASYTGSKVFVISHAGLKLSELTTGSYRLITDVSVNTEHMLAITLKDDGVICYTLNR